MGTLEIGDSDLVTPTSKNPSTDEVCQVAKTQPTYMTHSLIELFSRAKLWLISPGKMAGEQWKIGRNTPISTNLRIKSAGNDNLRSLFRKKERRT